MHLMFQAMVTKLHSPCALSTPAYLSGASPYWTNILAALPDDIHRTWPLLPLSEQSKLPPSAHQRIVINFFYCTPSWD